MTTFYICLIIHIISMIIGYLFAKWYYNTYKDILFSPTLFFIPIASQVLVVIVIIGFIFIELPTMGEGFWINHFKTKKK